MFSRYFRNRMQNFPLFLCEHQQTMMSKNHTPPTISSARPTEPDSPAPRGPPPARATPASHARRSKVQLQIAQMEMQMAKIKRRDVSVVSAVDVHYPAAELLVVRNNYRPHQQQILVVPSRPPRRGPSREIESYQGRQKRVDFLDFVQDARPQMLPSRGGRGVEAGRGGLEEVHDADLLSEFHGLGILSPPICILFPCTRCR